MTASAPSGGWAARPFDGYDRGRLVPTVAHLGPGVFHRAHQAVYCDRVLRTGERAGGVVGVSLRSAAVREALRAGDFRYHVVERSAHGPGPRARVSEIGALLDVQVATPDPRAALAALADPAVTVVTMTVTEHGYCAVRPGGELDLSRPEVLHDLEHSTLPRSVPGLLVEALRRRRAAGTAPFTVVSCDNLPANGTATARVVAGLAECLNPLLAEWIRRHVAFPSSMVDRMVPASTPGERGDPGSATPGDRWPVVTEPHSQWVLEDVFPEGRPRWERVGVELVHDVRPHEQAKLRILNAAHSALAYWGVLADHEYVWQAAADPLLRTAVRELLFTEVLPTLTPPPGWDLARYADEVLGRFENRALPYTTAKVAADGSQKLPVRVVPTILDRLRARVPAPWSVGVLAAWLACVTGGRPGRPGRPDVADAGLPAPQRRTAAGLLALPGLLDAQDPRQAQLAVVAADLAARLSRDGVLTVLPVLPALHARLALQASPCLPAPTNRTSTEEMS